MYPQTNPTEMFRERQLALLQETENRRLARRLRLAARRIPKEGSLMRHTILLLSTMTVGLLLAGGAALAATTGLTETFSNSSPIVIEDVIVDEPGSAAPSEITVSGFNQGRIRDVNLKLKGFSHTFPDDVGVLLVGPQGQKALVMSDVGGDLGVSGINLQPRTQTAGQSLS